MQVGVTIHDSQSHKEHIEVKKILKFGVNRVNMKQDTAT